MFDQDNIVGVESLVNLKDVKRPERRRDALHGLRVLLI